jgi:hypothetical protein
MNTELLAYGINDIHTIYSHECKKENVCLINLYLITFIVFIILPWIAISTIISIFKKSPYTAFFKMGLFVGIMSLL